VGAMRSGKSFDANQRVKAFCNRGGAGLIYNLGKPKDFDAAAEGELLSLKDHRRQIIKRGGGKAELSEFKQDPSFLYYRDPKGKLRDFKKFALENAGQALKFAPISDFKNSFIEAFYFYCPHTFLVIDDCKSIFRHGVPAEFEQLFSRINHAGTKVPTKNKDWIAAGADVLLIFHSIDQVNPVLWDWATHLIQFKSIAAPDFSKIGNRAIEIQAQKSWAALERLPRYSKSITDLHTTKTILEIPKF